MHKNGVNNMYSIIAELCKQRGMSVTGMCKDCGISPAAMTELKKGRTKKLSGQTLEKVAAYLGVSSDTLLGIKKEQPATGSDELLEILDACRDRSDLRGLFKTAKDLSADDIKKAMAILEALKNV